MHTVLDTLRWANMKFRDLTPDMQTSLSRNLLRVLNEKANANEDVVNLMHAFIGVIDWHDLSEQIQNELMGVVRSMETGCWLEDIYPIFNTLLQTLDSAEHRQDSSLNQHFVDTLDHVFDRAAWTSNEFEEPLLDCLTLAKKMGVSWDHLGSKVQESILLGILHESEDGFTRTLESLLLASANIGLRWEHLSTELKNEITKLHIGGKEHGGAELNTELRASYIRSLSFKNLNQWIEALTLLGLRPADISRESTDLWQRYKSSIQHTHRILDQFDRTWGQKGYDFSAEVLSKIGYFIHHDSPHNIERTFNHVSQHQNH